MGRAARELAFAIACGALTPVPAAQPRIALELSTCPERLTYPVPAGENPLITVTVHGGNAADVWLATSPRSAERVTLTRAGTHRYQINLASARVAESLERSGMRGELAIFARTEAGEVVASEPVRYSFIRSHPTRATIYVYASRSFESALAEADRPTWFDGATATRIEWYYGRARRAAPVEAGARGQRWPFVVDRSRRCATLIVTDEVREAWEAAGSLDVHPEGGRSVELRARPRTLRLARESMEFSVVQRRTVEVPGSRGWLHVHIGDITAGQVFLGVRDAEGDRVVTSRSVRPGDEVQLALGDARYAIHVAELVNLIVGNDFARLEVRRAREPGAPDPIDVLLSRVARAEITFLREGERYTGAEAAAHLRRKLAAAPEKPTSVDDFIAHIATRSSITGRPYLVETADGATEKLADWLRGLPPPRKR